jgi:hypothetical protein
MFHYIGYDIGFFLVFFFFFFFYNFFIKWGLRPNEVPLYWSLYLLYFFITQGAHKHGTFHYNGYDIFLIFFKIFLNTLACGASSFHCSGCGSFFNIFRT